MKFSISILVLFFSLNISAQWSTALSQAEFLTSFELTYNAPVEMTSTSMGEGSIGFYKYQMGVALDQSNILALLSFVPDNQDIAPHVEVSAKVATLASNDQDYVIEMVGPSSEERDLLNADWAAYSYFVPKKGTGRFKYGKLTAIFREGIGLVYIYYLYNDEVFELNELFQFMDLE